jgi:integrase
VRRHIIDGDELGRLAAAMGGVEGYGTMAYLGTVDGLRWGEVAGLHVGQFDFQARTMQITRTLVRGRKGAIGLGEPKSDAGRRTLAVPVALVEMVGKHMAARGLTVDDRTRYVGLGFHDLRRANATGLVAEGVDIKTAQAMLGHSNVQLTVGLYAQAVVSLGAAAAESMATRFQLPGSPPPRGRRAMDGDREADHGQAGEDTTP